MSDGLWIPERDLLGWLCEYLGIPIYYQEAPENTGDEFAVLQMIDLGASREISFFKLFCQLDIYGLNAEKASKKAEKAVFKLWDSHGEYGNTLLDSVRAERARLIRVEDGTYKSVIEIKANCIRRN